MAVPDSLQRLYTSLALSLNPSESERVLQAYNLAGAPDKRTLFDGLMALSSDIRFHLPVVKMGEGLKGKGYRYHFHQVRLQSPFSNPRTNLRKQPNPVSGQWKGYASHELDVGYLLGNFDAYLSESDRKLGKEMAGFWIGFANGEGLSGSKEGELLVIGPKEEMRFVQEEKYDGVYRKGSGKLWENIGWEKWFKLGESLQGC